MSKICREQKTIASWEKRGTAKANLAGKPIHSKTAPLLYRGRRVGKTYPKPNSPERNITDTGLVHLKRLTGLEFIDLNKTRIKDAGLVHLKGLTHLDWLILSGTKVTDLGLVHLKELSGLRRLYLDNTEITDAGLIHLEGMSGLRSLSLENTKATEAGVKKLKAALSKCSIFLE